MVLLNVLLFVASVHAHSMIISINDQTECLRELRTHVQDAGLYLDSPVMDPMSQDMICNQIGTTPAASTCDFAPGETIRLRWFHESFGVIFHNHHGPCAVYIAETYSGPWFKIYEDGYSDGKFCVDRLRENGGIVSFTLPEGLKAGNWVVRGELIALHQAALVYDGKDAGAQYYMRCADIKVSGSGTGIPENAISIPGYIQATDPGVHLNLEKDFKDESRNFIPSAEYQIPGGPLSTKLNNVSTGEEQKDEAPLIEKDPNGDENGEPLVDAETPNEETLPVSADGELPDKDKPKDNIPESDPKSIDISPGQKGKDSGKEGDEILQPLDLLPLEDEQTPAEIAPDIVPDDGKMRSRCKNKYISL